MPLALPATAFSAGYTNEYLNLVARLKPGVGLPRAQAEMTTFAENLKKANPNNFAPKWTLKVRTLDDIATGRIRPALLVLLGAVGLVLLIACANVANLLLARAAVRIKEIAIRSALGADRASLIRQLLTESIILSLSGGVLGLLLAESSVQSLVALNPNLPRASEVGIDGNVMIFTLVVSVLTGLLFGLAPALQTSRTNLNETLKDGSRSGAADFAGRNVRRGLVVAEVALSLTLLIGAALLIESVGKLQNVDPGFDPHNVLVFNLALPAVKYPSDTSQVLFGDQLVSRLSALSGVRSAGTTSVLPFAGGWSTSSFNIEGLIVPRGQNGPWGDYRVATTGLLRCDAHSSQDRALVHVAGSAGRAAGRRHRRAIRQEVLPERQSHRQAHHLRRRAGQDRFDVDHDRRRRRARGTRGARCGATHSVLLPLRADGRPADGRHGAHRREARSPCSRRCATRFTESIATCRCRTSTRWTSSSSRRWGSESCR